MPKKKNNQPKRQQEGTNPFGAAQPKQEEAFPSLGQEETKGTPTPASSTPGGGWSADMFQQVKARPATSSRPQQAQAAQPYGFNKAPRQSEQAYNPTRGQRGGARGGASRGGGRGGTAGGSRPSQLRLVSNQYLLRFTDDTCIYQYALTVMPDEIFDNDLVNSIIKLKNRFLYKNLGAYVASGKSIYTINPIEESFEIETTYKDQPCRIVIDKGTETLHTFNTDFCNRENTVSSQVFNIIVKTAFRSTHLRQLGRNPQFFDYDNPLRNPQLAKMRLQVIPGFKGTAFMTEMGLVLGVDTIFRFMSTITCLDKIKELKKESRNKAEFESKVGAQIVNASIIADYGRKRTYFVHEVDFTTNPADQRFVYNGQEVSVAEYFAQVYSLNISDFQQPLLKVKNAEDFIYLPPEFCLIDGVPDQIRASPGMRDCLAAVRQVPDKKKRDIQELVELIMNQKVFKDMNVTVDNVPIELSSSVLGEPQIFKQNQIIHINEQVLRNLSIQKSVSLDQNEWIMVYGQRNYNQAEQVFENFRKACGRLGIRVEEPHYIELRDERDLQDLEAQLQEYLMNDGGAFRHPKILVSILHNENNYKAYKDLCNVYQLPSQNITTRICRPFNLSKASNILRQINSKIGGDLFHLKFPEKMDNMRTMLIGIDVCHSGGNSIVGFSASINPEMSQYYSDFIVQKKGQEVVGKSLRDAMKTAIQVYAAHNKKKTPTDIIIYRDGVSSAERKQVVDQEISQFQQAIAESYNQAANKPKLALLIVNKRIIQQFFVKDHQGRLQNPPSGCIIDRGLVESSAAQSREFDFFMVPVEGNQGCMRPTHFFCPLNQTSLTKIEIEQLSYGLCHYYFNWTGPIKVPAPSMYAHKIADFYTRVSNSKKAKKPAGAKANQLTAGIQTVKPLNQKLHYL